MTRVKSSMLIAAIWVLHMVQGVPLVIENDLVCTTMDCYVLAQGILRDMDTQVDPCVDFSAYTCGNYKADEELPAYLATMDAFVATTDQNDLVMRYILESVGWDPAVVPENDTVAQQNLQKIRDLYASCMNEDQFTRLGRKPLQAVLQKIAQTFPVSDSLMPYLQGPYSHGTNTETVEGGLNNTGLSLTLSYFNRLGLHTIARIAPAIDSTNSSVAILGLVEGGAGLKEPRYYQDEQKSRLYKSTMAKMLGQLLSIDAEEESTLAAISNTLPETISPSHWEDTAQQIFDFEKRLSEAYTDLAELTGPIPSSNVLSSDQIAFLTPSIDWDLFLDDLLPAELQRPQPIVVASPLYQKRLETLLQTTEPRTLQAYFVWSAIAQLVQNIAPEYELPLRQLHAAYKGSPAAPNPDRWLRCVEVVNWNLGQMAGFFFMWMSYRDGSHAMVTEMVDSLRSTYEVLFPSLSWLDPTTLARASEKLKAMVTVVGYSKESPDAQSSESLRSFYEGYQVDRDKFFENDIQFRLWRSAVEYSFLERPLDREKNMPFAPQTVNAYFDPTANRILLPAGLLQPGFFHVDYPEYVNYGGLGSVIGHEFTHAFDDSGHWFDEGGRLLNWWTNATVEAYAEKAKCFVNQYNNFTITTPDGRTYNVSGERTLDENLADNGGVRQAFAAWQARFSSDLFGRRYRNFKLPGLNDFTVEQLFFISYGRSWCRKMRPEVLASYVQTSRYSPNNWRVNGALQNSDQFARAFGCSAGSPMNPQVKCQLW
ncbi:hypothetical protein BGZ68_003442 [Mortierella alpina]|nr:hypothetical protein BGZ68_003442 [Mortierella alpina]